MVYESPAAGRPMVCRKHSPWTMERDRKKSKAHLGSPEPLSEEVEEEEEGEEPDDHEMTEQEAQVLACLGQLHVGSSLAQQGEPDGTTLSKAGLAPDGQRRKLRGSRALSESYRNRLRSCALNEKGSPLPHSSRSYTTGAGGGQENMAPITFGPVMFADHAKCWLGRRQSPTAKDTSGDPLQHQGSTGVVHPTSFPAHGLALNTAADRSLLATAALGSSSRCEKHISCDSPAPKGRSHRRSLSGASVVTACGLNDSAEALHGASEACAAGQGQTPLPGEWPHLRSTSEGSAAQRLGPIFKQAGATGGDQNLERIGQAVTAQGSGDSAPARNTSDLPVQSRYPSISSASALGSAPATSAAYLAKYGIAAFGVPASVQSCFVDSITASAQHSEVAAAAGPTGPQHDLARCVMSCPEGMCNVTTAAGALGRHVANPADQGGFLTSDSRSGHGSPLGDDIEPLAGESSEPVLGGGHVRYGGSSLGSGSGKALADSAEELELRRLAAAAGQLSPRQGSLPNQQTTHPPPPLQQLQQQTALAGVAAHSRPSSMGSASAAVAAAGTVAAAMSEPLPGPLAKPSFAPFDLLSLARSAGSVFGTANLANSSTLGHFTTDAVQGAVGGPTLPQTVSLWPAAQNGDPRYDSGSLASNSDDSTKPGLDLGAGGLKSWSASGFANLNKADALARVGVDKAAAAAAVNDAQEYGGPVLELTCSVGNGATDLGDVRTDQDDGAVGGEDGEESWLRTSQQAPDPDDPSSAGKYSAVLLRRLQAAAEHEELYGVPASGGHSGAYSFFHLQGSCGSDHGLRSSSGRLHLGSHGSSSMEPSPMPRLSSRLRRLRASPCPGSSGSSGPLTSPAPSLLLGTRSRSAGVTPGGVTCRRLRRRSDLQVPDQLGQGGSASARGHADVDELEDSDEERGADENMHDAGQQLLSAGGSEDTLRLLAARMGEQAGNRRRDVALPLRPLRGSGSGLQPLTVSPGLPRLPDQQQQGANDPADRAHPAVGQLLQHHRLHGGNDFLSGLMDYEDDGVEYMTPPHTPLRGISGAHDHDAATAPRAALSGFTLCGGGPNPAAAVAGEGFFAVAPGRGRPGPSKGILPQRVTFVSHRQGDPDTLPASPIMEAAGSCGDNSSCAQMLMSQSLSNTQDFNRCLAAAANNNDRGAAERLWQEMCSRGITPDINTLNSLLRCLSRSAADPDEAHLLVREICGRGGFDVNGTSQRLLEEICFRFEQLNGDAQG